MVNNIILLRMRNIHDNKLDVSKLEDKIYHLDKTYVTLLENDD